MKIGNVLFETELVNHYRVDYINYCQKSSDVDVNLPTLIVGWKFMKDQYPDDTVIKNVKILEKTIISNELYWEFSFDENKSAHVAGVNSFVLNVPNFFFDSKYRYINLDPIFFNFETTEDVINFLPNEIDAVYCYRNKMIYFIVNDLITGINLELCSFFKLDVIKISETFHIKTKRFFDDVDGNLFASFYKFFPKFPLLKRYLITMLF